MNTKSDVKNRLALLLVLLWVLPMVAQQAYGAERMRLIIDTDAMAEVDDQHALAYALFSGNHFEVEGITVNRGSDGPHRTDRDQDIDDHFREAVSVVKMCNADVPVFKGPAGNYQQLKSDIGNSTFDGSDAVHLIIERAQAPSDRPLIIYACGNLTNVALALLKDPTIAPKIEIWWLGTEWPNNYACNNHVGDLDAVDALLANPQNVSFNIIPWPHGIWTNHAEIYEKMPGKGPKVSPGVPGRWGGSFTCFGDYSVELFKRGVWSGQKRRSLLDAFGLAVLKNKSWFTPKEMGAPSFKRTDTGAEEKHKYPGEWVANESNPRRVTFWTDGQKAPVIADFFNTFDNYVLVGSTSFARDASQIHHREHNFLLDATLSGNMDSFNKGLRGFDGGACQPKFLVYDFKKQDFLGFSHWVHHPTKKLAIKTDWYAFGVKKDADLGVVPENKAAHWMAEWQAPISANFITLMGSYPEESSQASTAWKIELRSNGQWRVHARGVGGWYDRGQYFWGGRDVEPILFDGLRVSLFSKGEKTPLKNIHFRAQENRTWMVALLPAIDARIAVAQQVPRAGQGSDLPWYFPDVMPTLAQLAGVSEEVPKDIDGISIVPTLLAKGKQETHKYPFWQENGQAVRMGQWKGIGKPGAVKLYDLSKDIGENRDLAAQHPDIAKQIGDIMAEAWVAPRSQQDDGRYPAPKGETEKKTKR